MKSSTRYVILCTIMFCLSIADAKSLSKKEIAEDRAMFKQTLETVKFIVTSDIVKTMASNFKYLAPLLGPVGTILGGVLFFMGTQEKTELANFREIQSKLDDLAKKVVEISNQLTMMQASMEIKMKVETTKYKVFETFVSLENRISKIKVKRDRLDNIIGASAWLRHASDLLQGNNQTTNDTMTISQYQHDKEHLLGNLLSFAQEISDNHGSLALVVALDDDGWSGIPSLITALIDYGKHVSQNRWSITKMIFMIHMRITMYAFEEIALAEYATVLYGNITGTDFGIKMRQFESTRNKLKVKLASKAQIASRKLSSDDCSERPLLKILPAERVVKLENFLQLFWAIEQEFGPNESMCRKRCSFDKEIPYTNNGCNGTVRACAVSEIPKVLKMRYQTPQVDKIYTQYYWIEEGYWDNKAADYTHDDGLRSVKSLRYVNRWCDLCKCVCDQHNSLHTVRRFYMMPIAAERHQHVVTGVRFVARNRGIFLQIQTGKLQSLGLIDQSSVSWQDLPEYDLGEFVELTWGNESVLFNNIAAINESSVVTGFAFEKHPLGVSLKLFKRPIINFSTGDLGDQYAEQPASIEKQMKNVDRPVEKIEGLNPTKPSANQFNISVEAVRYVFGMSGEKDYGQSCLPQFDGSKITFRVRAALSHVKFIRYSNDDKYAGYIRPVLRSLNYNYWYFERA